MSFEPKTLRGVDYDQYLYYLRGDLEQLLEYLVICSLHQDVVQSLAFQFGFLYLSAQIPRRKGQMLLVDYQNQCL